MLGWLGDLGRLYWGLLYWNLRKTLFRIRGASGPAPCQHPSDSGLAGRTACEACMGWRDPARFRRMCPLLAAGQDGRRVCSVDSAAVRPFWGRAGAVYAGTAAALVLAAVLGVFSAFWAIGYKVPLRVVAWPPAWGRVRLARSDYFYRVALRANASGDVRQTYLALSQAYSMNPDNVAAARMLAQYAQIANPDYSDAIYSRLVLGHVGDYEDTAQIWLRAILSRGDFPSVAGLSARMLRDGAKFSPAWAQALLFAERMSGDPAEVDRLLAGPGRTSAEAGSVLSLAKSLRGEPAGLRARTLSFYVEGATTAFELYFALGRLTEERRGSDVVAYLDGRGAGPLGVYDRELLKLDAYSAMGWKVVEQREIEALLYQGTSVPVATLLSGHFVRYPDARGAGHVFELLDAEPVPADAGHIGAHLALLCMAGVNGLDARLRQEADAVGRIAGGAFPNRAHILEFFEDRSPSKSASALLPALPQLPLELMYALTAHYPGPRAPADHRDGAP
jgi:hypothetical protein